MTDNRYELLEAEIQRLTAENNQLKALTMSHTTTALEPYDKRLLTDLTKMWSEACEIARQYCPVDVGRNHIKEGIPRLAKRAADAEAERDKLRAQIEVYKDDCRDVMPIHWAFAGDEYAKPLASEPKEHTPTTDKTYDLFNEVMVKKPWQPLMNESGGRHSFLGALEGGLGRDRGMGNEVCKELMQKIDTKIVEELSIASIVKANAELKKRVEILEETVVEYLKEGKK